MSDDYSNIFEQPYRPVEEMSPDEIKKELDQWRKLWTWVERETQFWLTRVGTEVVVVRRDYKKIQGNLGQSHFELKAVEVDTVERIYNYSKGEATYEHKTVLIPIGSITDYEFVYGKEVKDEDLDGRLVTESKESLE